MVQCLICTMRVPRDIFVHSINFEPFEIQGRQTERTLAGWLGVDDRAECYIDMRVLTSVWSLDI